MRKIALLLLGLVVAILVALGLVVLSSASEANGLRLYGDQYHFMKRQFMYLGVGLIALVGTAWFDYRKLREHWILPALGYIVIFALLLLVFNYKEVNGSHRWIFLGPVRLQPSEFAKLIIVIVISIWMDKAGWRVELFRRGVLYPICLIGFLALPVMLEPDFGSTMVIGAIGLLIMFVAGARVRHMLPFGLVGFAFVAFKVLTNENRRRRIMGFFDPETLAFFGIKVPEVAANAPIDPAAYQVEMSLVAFRNGGIWGVGLGESMQKHAYLPEAHTDFIFAVGAEELGLFFSLAVIVFFFMFFGLSIYIARTATDRLGRFLVMGMSFLIFSQAMINLAVVCKAFLTKGMALPFFSYGGTNLLCACLAVGMIFSVGIHSAADRKRRVTPAVRTR